MVKAIFLLVTIVIYEGSEFYVDFPFLFVLKLVNKFSERSAQSDAEITISFISAAHDIVCNSRLPRFHKVCTY